MYVSRPANVKEPLPAVLVLQEVWGVSAHIRDVTDRFAKAGYVAAAPDLYAENGERPELLSDERIERVRTFLHSAPPQAFRDPAVREAALAERPEAERRLVQPSADALLAMPGRLPELVERTRAAYRFLQRYEPANGRTAAVGYCLGGALSARLAAAEPELAGAVVYYGRLAGSSRRASAARCSASSAASTPASTRSCRTLPGRWRSRAKPSLPMCTTAPSTRSSTTPAPGTASKPRATRGCGRLPFFATRSLSPPVNAGPPMNHRDYRPPQFICPT
ncbi:dienelactone hydrolase family protein [Paenibacillus sp. CC-CFT747]|nr:dienelactone hydrolase family protein [Paenibacillus sp. CC-CFT747]